jgi:Calx-beta domain/Peptidase M10 serralysin C terminal
MAVGDIKIFNFVYKGLTLRVEAFDLGDGKTALRITSLEGSADIKALYWSDGEDDRSSKRRDRDDRSRDDDSKNRDDDDRRDNGGRSRDGDDEDRGHANSYALGEDWDGFVKLPSRGHGQDGSNRPARLEQGETLELTANVKWASIETFGVRATNLRDSGGTMKCVDRVADVVRAPEIRVGDVEVTEGDDPAAVFTVSLSRAYSYDIMISYSTRDGTALAGSDYAGVTGTVTIRAGQTSATITVPVLDDASKEANEVFTLKLGKATADIPGTDIRLAIADGRATGTILDDDAGGGGPAPTVTIGNAVVAEGGALVFAISLSNPSFEAVTLNLAAAGGTALADTDFETSGFDYSTDGGATWQPATGNNVTFAAGATSLMVRVDTSEDATFEPDETMTLSATVVSGTVTAAGDTGTGTVTNDDAAPTVTIGDASVDEGDALVFDVSLSNPSHEAVTLNLAAVGGTALADTDFETSGFDYSTDGGATWQPATGNNVTFAAGATSLMVRVDSIEDSSVEPDETFALGVASFSGTLAASGDIGTGTITNDDIVLIDAITTNDFDTHDVNGVAHVQSPATGDGHVFTGTTAADTLVATNDTLIGDTVSGLNGGDVIYGRAGNDVLQGQNQTDRIFAGSGNDTLFGGGGGAPSDTLYGGSGNDVFAYTATTESTIAARDSIEDFRVGFDKINLSAIDANGALAGDQAFVFFNNATPTSVPAGTTYLNGVSWYEASGYTWIVVDSNGSPGAEMMIGLHATGLGLQASDFIL